MGGSECLVDYPGLLLASVLTRRYRVTVLTSLPLQVVRIDVWLPFSTESAASAYRAELDAECALPLPQWLGSG